MDAPHRVQQQDPAQYETERARRLPSAGAAFAELGEALRIEREDAIVAQALGILRTRAMRVTYFTSPSDLREYLTIKYSPVEREEFGAVFLDRQHGLLRDQSLQPMFSGTIAESAVYPREVVKAALACNAAAAVLYHNHPSGSPEPSEADRRLTDRLRETLALVGVRVLDHVVVGGGQWVSFAERGWI